MSESAFHPVAELFPLMPEAQLEELAADIAENGQREPIWRFKGRIIDGRNRYAACMKYGVTPTYQEYEGEGNGDLVKFVVSLNLHRRHLNEAQRAMIAAKIANTPNGGAIYRTRHDGTENTVNNTEAGKLMQVGDESVGKARAIRRDAIPEVVAAVESGELSLRAASDIAKEPTEKQAEVLKGRREGNAKQQNGKTANTRALPSRNAEQKAKAIRNALGTLVGLSSSLSEFNAKDANFTKDEAEQWDKELSEVLSVIRQFRRQLTEAVNGK